MRTAGWPVCAGSSKHSNTHRRRSDPCQEFRVASRWSPARRRASGPRSRRGWPATGHRWASSTSALGNRGQSNYSTAKAGLQGLTKTLAIELGPFGVTANAIAPGFIETAMTKATAERLGTTIEQMREATASMVPVRRGGVPEDISNAVAFFAGEESGYVTGQVIYVDGGRGLL